MFTHELINYSVKIQNRVLVICHGENLELGTGFRVLVVEERKESERLGKMWLNRVLGKSLVVQFV